MGPDRASKDENMSKLARFLLVCSAVAGLLGVALGAFGAHALRGRVGVDAMIVYQAAVQYQFWHALGLGLIGLLLLREPSSKALQWAGLLMAAGIVLFSGSVYALVFSGVRTWAVAAPVGGLCWLVAWGLFAWAMLRTAVK
jgi:uncharacterized membrane protein YgdD (TMEM256/DUF423 family)